MRGFAVVNSAFAVGWIVVAVRVLVTDYDPPPWAVALLCGLLAFDRLVDAVDDWRRYR